MRIGGGPIKALGLKDGENHPRRCQRILRNGNQCGQWGCVGSKWCKMHGGTRGRKRHGVGVAHLPQFYRGRLTKTLERAVADANSVAPHEAINLYEELALVREASGEAVLLYSLAYEARSRLDQHKDKEKYEALSNSCMMGGAIMVDALKQVEHFCTAIARIEAVSKDKINIHTLHGAMRQVVRIMYECCGTEHLEIAQKFEKLVREEVVLPNTGSAEGIGLTPGALEADVLDMDDSIPAEPESGLEE